MASLTRIHNQQTTNGFPNHYPQITTNGFPNTNVPNIYKPQIHTLDQIVSLVHSIFYHWIVSLAYNRWFIQYIIIGLYR
ncbi:hypothetical protein DERP_011167 [Dermatophagoides pteronyssinus]|uniref:Uncharacterized protein n=1 Tax=Dermatophagoides pteronyssinus TaxID=6956 RepID=A0ABQ8J904_DERPT|nr:hypothetical protein DERP_011167 [Dermatophagoides pteronyssinus]